MGPLDPVTGLAADAEAMDMLVRERVLACMDHRNLNVEVKPFGDVVPTSENLAIEICRRLKAGWRSAFAGEWPVLESVRIAETPRNIFEIRADEIE
jgi:6-pyruvoyl-tetrahydropterin synthase